MNEIFAISTRCSLLELRVSLLRCSWFVERRRYGYNVYNRVHLLYRNVEAVR